MPSSFTQVLIIGAGASGLFCAAHAGKRGRQVMVIDHTNKVGKKILMSGGGKCNFTNLEVSPENYLSQNPHFCKSALKRYTNWDFLRLVNEHKIAYEERDHGQLFCVNSAKDILNMLLSECQQAGVSIFCHTQINQIMTLAASAAITTDSNLAKNSKIRHNNTYPSANFCVQTNHGTIYCESLVVATGGLSIPTMGATGLGYQVAKQFGHTIVPTHAGLVPFTFTDGNNGMGAMAKSLAGNALLVTASNTHIGFTDPMLFTHRGLSGPAILQISNYWRPSETLNLDLVPQHDLANFLLQQKLYHPKTLLRTALANFFSKNLLLALENLLWQPLKATPLANINDKKLHAIAQNLHSFSIKPSGTEGYRTAEVTLGGVNTQQVSSKTFTSQLQPHLYFIGEVLDVTGWLGGYNFQWAWSSGFCAAQAV